MTDELTFPFPDPPQPGGAVEIASDILWIRLPLPMALDHVNVYALGDCDGWTLIDTGMNSTRSRAQWQGLLAGPLAGRPVARVLLTHHHPDHVGLAGWFQSRGADLWATRTAWLYARMLTLDRQDQPSPESLDFARRAGMPPAMLAQKMAERPFNFADCVAPMPLGFRALEEGQILTLAGRRWRLRLGQGHAPDHATLWQEDGDLVIAGDQVLPGISPNIGVYPTEPGANPLAGWLDSCAAFLPLARPGQLVLPGHKLPFRGLPFRLGQMISGHMTALDRLREALAEPKTAVDCFPALFRREIGPAEFGLAMGEAVAHLNWLLARGELRRSRGDASAPDLWKRV